MNRKKGKTNRDRKKQKKNGKNHIYSQKHIRIVNNLKNKK